MVWRMPGALGSSTGTSSTRANCHPFAHGPYLFMHNGQIGGYSRIKRRIEALIPDSLYDERRGTTESEAIFLLALRGRLRGSSVPRGPPASTRPDGSGPGSPCSPRPETCG